MGEVKGFLTYDRKDFNKESVLERIKHWQEFLVPLSEEELKQQGARCMDCGIPFCHAFCPLGNLIPDFNDLVYQGRWKEALERLLQTNPFPEFTGRICPAPCEAACVLAINQPAVTIKNIELSIIEKAYKKGWMKPNPPQKLTGKKVAVVGSGPAGLTCAYALNQLGHLVTVYEKNETIGGLLRLGIPDFKLEKYVIDRRIDLMKEEGITFKTNVHISVDTKAGELFKEHDAIVLCGGAEKERELPVPGRNLKGIYQAMTYLTGQNRGNINYGRPVQEKISAKGKKVVVIGGGDTGADCVGTAHRQGAASVKQLELLPEPPLERDNDNPWPEWPLTKKIGSSHEEGVEQYFGVQTKEFIGAAGNVAELKVVRMEFSPKDKKTGRRSMREIPGSDFTIEADLVLLAIGFLGPVQEGMIKELNLDLDSRGNVKTDLSKMTSKAGVFAAGDMASGQSLVVRAISEGLEAACGVNKYLTKI